MMVFCGVIVFRSVVNAERCLHPARKPLVRPDLSKDRLPLKDVSFRTSDHLTLRGWYIPSRNRAAIIVTHGFGDNRADMAPEMLLLARHGYGVLLFDWRGHGESEGDLVTSGDKERRDLYAALDHLSTHPEVDPKRIGVLGFSMGGDIAACAASSDQRIAALILEGCDASLRDSLSMDFGKWGMLSLLPAICCYRIAGVDLDAVQPAAALSRIRPRPVLIINGTVNDTDARTEARLCRAGGSTCQCWTIQGASHGGYAQAAPNAYPDRLLNFFDRALKPE